LVADAPEFGQSLFVRALYGGGIFQAPMNALGCGGGNGATLFGAVTHGDDVIEMLPRKFLNGFGAVTRDVNAGLPHDLDGFWADITRLDPRAEDFVGRPAVVSKQAFGHLAARGVSGTQDQNSHSFPPVQKLTQAKARVEAFDVEEKKSLAPS